MAPNILRLLTSRRARNAFRVKRVFARAPTDVELRGGNFDRTVIATVAFNRPDVIEWQFHLVRKYLAERSGYIVFDNSTISDKRTAIRAVCRREGVPYVGLPPIPFQGSASHGVALNWIARNFIARHNPDLFGFLDHDIFPLEPVSIGAKIAEGRVYGRRVERADTWYMWPGFCFFSGIDPLLLDFLPVGLPHVYLDTGGSNWDRLYRHLEVSEVNSAHDTAMPSTASGRPFDLMDGWLHAGEVGWSGHTTPKDRAAVLLSWLREAYGEGAPDIPIAEV